jgi:subtilisin family serine protease
MSQLSWLGSETRPGRKPVWFAQGELLVVSDHRQAAERLLGRGVQEAELAPGLIRYRSGDLDVAATVRRLREGQSGAGLVASPNHVFVSTPYEHGGPFGPPVPAVKPRAKAGTRPGGEVPVAVLDTGVWRNSPLPASAYTATLADYEDDTDVDDDGVIDGDVGHANFIIGVIGAQTRKASIRAVRVLDTFGLCTEADLIVALGQLRDEKLINLSLGGFTLDDQPPLALSLTLSTVLSGKDRLIVAAAGNDGQRGRPFWPAAFATSGQPWSAQVVAVAAHNTAAICDWSNTGGWVTAVAPGADITSTFVRHDQFPSGWALWSGTSFAAPHVVALLAEQIAKGVTCDAALKTVLASAGTHFDGYPVLS